MRLFQAAVAAAFCLSAACAHAAGLRLIKVKTDGAEPLQIAVWSPCEIGRVHV